MVKSPLVEIGRGGVVGGSPAGEDRGNTNTLDLSRRCRRIGPGVALINETHGKRGGQAVLPRFPWVFLL